MEIWSNKKKNRNFASVSKVNRAQSKFRVFMALKITYFSTILFNLKKTKNILHSIFIYEKTVEFLFRNG